MLAITASVKHISEKHITLTDIKEYGHDLLSSQPRKRKS